MPPCRTPIGVFSRPPGAWPGISPRRRPWPAWRCRQASKLQRTGRAGLGGRLVLCLPAAARAARRGRCRPASSPPRDRHALCADAACRGRPDGLFPGHDAGRRHPARARPGLRADPGHLRAMVTPAGARRRQRCVPGAKGASPSARKLDKKKHNPGASRTPPASTARPATWCPRNSMTRSAPPISAIPRRRKWTNTSAHW